MRHLHVSTFLASAGIALLVAVGCGSNVNGNTGGSGGYTWWAAGSVQGA
jgi:hypothetical protein